MWIWILLAVLLAFSISRFQQKVPFSSLRGKAVLVCGASMGIGRELALQYARANARVVLASRNEAQLQTVAEECRKLGAAEAHVVAADLGNEDACRLLIEKTLRLMNSELDVLVLNHIKPYFGLFQEQTTQTLRDVISVNLLSYVNLTFFALPHLKRCRNGGSIIAVSSVAGQMGVPYVAIYSASKHALHGFFDSLRQELRMENEALRKSEPPRTEPLCTVTVCVLGNIETESARQVTAGQVNLPRHPADGCARAIVQGGLNRVRTVFYPVVEPLLSSLLYRMCPSLLDYASRKIMSGGGDKEGKKD